MTNATSGASSSDGATGSATGRVAEELLRLHDVTKTYPNGTRALVGVSFAVREGEVHGLIGANGAGKSTLIKILSGATPASTGAITWRGETVSWRNPRDARHAGMSTIYQDFPLVPTLSVLENVFLDRTEFRRRPRHFRELYAQLLDRAGFEIDPDQLVSDLSIGQRQTVAILQAISSGGQFVIMDEPTASLDRREREMVFDVVRRLSAAGTTFLYISHFLDEIVDLCDWATVLRDGRVVYETSTSNSNQDELVTAVVGTALAADVRHRAMTGDEAVPASTEPRADQPLLQVRDLVSPTGVRVESLDVFPGEIVGLAGVLGSGRSEILHAIFGADRRAHGDVSIGGVQRGRSIKNALTAGLALVPEDRTNQGLVGPFELWKNLSLPALGELSRRGGIVSSKQERAAARKAIEVMHITTPGVDALASELSGGNAQKVLLARWLLSDAKVLLLDEPTAGVDIGAKTDILRSCRTMTQDGRAVVLVSSDFEDLLVSCDRIVIVRDGRIIAERQARDTTEAELHHLVNGLPGGVGTATGTTDRRNIA